MKLNFHWWNKPLPGCTHGPQTWPWWRLFGFLICHIDNSQERGWRLWIYTRAGGRSVDLWFERPPR